MVQRETLERLTLLTSAGMPLGAMESRVGILRSSIELLHQPTMLSQRIEEDGYLFLPGLLDPHLVLRARQPIVTDLAAKGYLNSAYPTDIAVLQPNSGFSATDYGEKPYPVDSNPDLKRLLSNSALPELMSRILGAEVKHSDRTLIRARSGDQPSATYPHCDSVFMGRGSRRLYTAWIPLGDVPLSMGGLMILEKSHLNSELKREYALRDIDEFDATSPEAIDWVVGKKRWDGKLSDDPCWVQDKFGGRWLTAPFSAGDVLLFDIHTVHASADNHTDRIRLSIDTRYLSAAGVMDERWVGVDSIGHSREALRGLLGKKPVWSDNTSRGRLVIRGHGARAIALGVFFASLNMDICFVLDRPDLMAERIEAELSVVSSRSSNICSMSNMRDRIELRMGYGALNNCEFYVDAGDEPRSVRFREFKCAADHFANAALAVVGNIDPADMDMDTSIMSRMVMLEYSAELEPLIAPTTYTRECILKRWLRTGVSYHQP